MKTNTSKRARTLGSIVAAATISMFALITGPAQAAPVEDSLYSTSAIDVLGNDDVVPVGLSINLNLGGHYKSRRYRNHNPGGSHSWYYAHRDDIGHNRRFHRNSDKRAYRNSRSFSQPRHFKSRRFNSRRYYKRY